MSSSIKPRTQGRDFEPKILGFLCNWCAYAGADLAGVSRYQFPPHMRVIRVMCSSRVDPAFVFRAFAEGVDGILIGGCHLADCHYLDGNYQALRTVSIYKKILEQIDVSPERLRIEWVSASEGLHFAEVVSDFTKQIKELGPLEIGKEKDIKALKLKLQAAVNLVPYTKLAQGEKFQVRLDTEEEYEEFFNRDKVKRLFNELIVDKLVISEFSLLLRERQLSIKEISEILGLSSSQLSRLFDGLTRKGVVSCDESRKQFVPVEDGDTEKRLAKSRKLGTALVSHNEVDHFIDKYQGDPSSLTQILLDIQHEKHWLPKEALEALSWKLDIPLARIYHIATFYKAFSLVPKGRHVISLCTGTACQVLGSPSILNAVQRASGIGPGETDSELKFSLQTVNCLGCCASAPVMVIDGKPYTKMTPTKVEDVLQSYD